MESTIPERLLPLSTGFLSTTSTIFWWLAPDMTDRSSVPNLSSDKLKHRRRGNERRKSRESFACEKSRCRTFGKIIFSIHVTY